MPSVDFFAESDGTGHHHVFENMETEMTEHAHIIEDEQNRLTEENEHDNVRGMEEDLMEAEYSFDSEYEPDDPLEYTPYSLIDIHSPNHGFVMTSLISQTGPTSYQEFMTLFRNGSLHNSLNKEPTCPYHFGRHDRPSRPVADPDLVYH